MSTPLRRWEFSEIVGDHAAPGSTFGRRQEDTLSSEERPRPGEWPFFPDSSGVPPAEGVEVNDSPQPDPPCGGLHDSRIAGPCSARTFPSPPRTRTPRPAQPLVLISRPWVPMTSEMDSLAPVQLPDESSGD